MNHRNLVLSTFCGLALVAGSASAAILTNGTVNTSPATADLTAAGSLDWAIWNSTSDSAVSSRTASNRKSGGPNLFSTITSTTGGGNVRGVPDLLQTFTYTDGTSPASQTNATIGGVIRSPLGTIGEGVRLEVTGDPLQTYLVQIWASGGNGSTTTGQMTASLTGATNIVLDSQVYSTRVGTLFSFTFRPDNVVDRLILDYRISATDSSNGFVGIQAAAVSVVPEPSTLLLGGLGAMGALVIYRRNRGKRAK